MPDHWDPVCEETFKEAKRQAEALKHTWLGTEHVALAMLALPTSQLAGKLRFLGRDPGALVKLMIADMEGQGAPASEAGLPLTPRMKQAVAIAESAAAESKDEQIGEGHLLQALVDAGPGTFIRALLKWGIEPGALLRAPWQAPKQAPRVAALRETAVDGESAPAPPPKKAVRRPERVPAVAPVPVPLSHNPVLMDFGVVTPPRPASRTPRLDRLGRDLTALARDGRLPGLVPRPDLLSELELDLCRSGRGATILAGPSGCGKTALLELLALHVVAGHSMPELQGLRIIELPAVDVLGAGFEPVLAELEDQRLLLALDEVDRAGYAGLKHLLDRPELLVVGTCTPEALEAFTAAEAGLRRRLRIVEVPPTRRDETLAILQSRSVRHGTTVLPEALDAACEVETGTMPDAALDVLEEACLRARREGRPVDRGMVGAVLARRVPK